jgi:hypothetical protein
MLTCTACLDLVGWATSDGAGHVFSCGYRGVIPPQLVPKCLVSLENTVLSLSELINMLQVVKIKLLD